jgi:hypothetical protein
MWCKKKLYLGLIKHNAMKMYGRLEVQLHAFLTLVLDGGELSAPGQTHRNKPVSTVTRPRAGLGNVGSIPGRGRCLFSIASWLALGPTQPPIQWLPRVTRPERADGHLYPEPRLRMDEAIPHFPIRLRGEVQLYLYGEVAGTTNL